MWSDGEDSPDSSERLTELQQWYNALRDERNAEKPRP